MRMFCDFIWVGLDVYALFAGMMVHKMFLRAAGGEAPLRRGLRPRQLPRTRGSLRCRD